MGLPDICRLTWQLCVIRLRFNASVNLLKLGKNRHHFQMHFFSEVFCLLYFYSNFFEICSWGYNFQYLSIGWVNDLASSRQQTITSTNILTKMCNTIWRHKATVCETRFSKIPHTHTPVQSYPFSRKGVFFNGRREFAKSRKRLIFSGISPWNFGKRLQFCVYLSPFVCSACLNCNA